MHIQARFNETRLPVLHALIEAQPLGTLVVMGKDGLDANHMPFQLDTSVPGKGVLRAHLPKGSPLWQDGHAPGAEALVIFQGEQRYITPSWYAAKQEHGEVVPTWNYAVVHAYGHPVFHTDREWLRAHVTALTTRHESGQALPWQVTDAPAQYIDRMLDSIVGVELVITRLLGKWKVSQNRSQADREGVVAGLEAQGGEAAAAMASLVRRSLQSD